MPAQAQGKPPGAGRRTNVTMGASGQSRPLVVGRPLARVRRDVTGVQSIATRRWSAVALALAVCTVWIEVALIFGEASVTGERATAPRDSASALHSGSPLLLRTDLALS